MKSKTEMELVEDIEYRLFRYGVLILATEELLGIESIEVPEFIKNYLVRLTKERGDDEEQINSL